MTALSLISLSTVQTSPNYSHCLPSRWHAHWIIDDCLAPISLKPSPMGTRQTVIRYLPTNTLSPLSDSSLNFHDVRKLFLMIQLCEADRLIVSYVLQKCIIIYKIKGRHGFLNNCYVTLKLCPYNSNVLHAICIICQGNLVHKQIVVENNNQMSAFGPIPLLTYSWP